jgi:hypothetical protein
MRLKVLVPVFARGVQIKWGYGRTGERLTIMS